MYMVILILYNLSYHGTIDLTIVIKPHYDNYKVYMYWKKIVNSALMINGKLWFCKL